MSDHVHENLRRVMAEQGLSVRRLAARSELDPRTIRAILRGGSRPHAPTLRRLAEGLGVRIEELFVDPAQLLYRRFDQATNPAVEALLEARPKLFDGWTEADFDELHSRVGTGGGLTFEGAEEAVERMNHKRRLHGQLDLLLETSQGSMIGGIIELLYEQVVVNGRPADGRAAPIAGEEVHRP